jgi:hypothetical protein
MKACDQHSTSELSRFQIIFDHYSGIKPPDFVDLAYILNHPHER